MVTYRSGALARLVRTVAPAAKDTFRGLLTAAPNSSAPPPEPFEHSHAPGTVLATATLDAIGLRNLKTATRFSYVTRSADGDLLPCTGAMFRSGQEGPLIAFAPSTQGVARHCDPSYTSAFGANPWKLAFAYEQPVINWFLEHGADVVVTDYPRDPNTDVQLYCDHQAGANALADAIVAARTTFGRTGALGVWGFSQGGGAAAALVESTTGEAPRASVIGAPPVHLDDVLVHVDGGIATGVIAYCVGAIAATNPEAREELHHALTPGGAAELERLMMTCAGSAVVKSGWRATHQWTRTGQPLGELINDLPACRAEIDRRVLGKGSPRGKVRLWASLHDDVVPASTVDKLALRWACSDYTVRDMRSLPGRAALNHFVPYYRHFADDGTWLLRALR